MRGYMKGIKYLVFGYLLLAFFLSQIGYVWAGEENPTTIKIGVLARRGFDECLIEWSPTAQYLSERLPGIAFKIVPLNFREISPAVENNQVDFVIANPFIYVELQNLYGISRMATLKRLTPQGYTAHFGGSIFCRADRGNISSMDDLKGHSFAAVDETSFGGWMVAWRELKKAGIDPYRHFKGLTFGGTHDGVVFAVQDGKVDAGTVATPILAQMIAEGKISPDTFKILNVQEETSISYGLSTRLYPEWPFSKLKRTPDDIAEKIAVALLAMPKQSSAAIAAGIAGWTVPFDYTQVQTCMQELQVGIFKEYGRITLTQMFSIYRWQSLSVISMLIILTSLLLYSRKLNQRLQTSEITLLEEMQKRLQANKALSRANETLNQSQQELANIIDFLPDATLVLDKDKRVITWNRAMEEMTGVSKEVMIGQGDHAYTVPFYWQKRQHLLDFLDLEDDELRKQYKNVSKKGHTLYGETFAPALYNGKGAIIWATGAPLFDGHGNCFGAIESIRDITSQKQIEEELESALNLLQNITNQVPGVVYQYRLHPDGSSCFPFASAALNEMYGISPAEVLEDDSKVFDLYHPDDRDGIIASIRKSAQDLTPWLHEFRLKLYDDTERWVSGSSTPQREKDGSTLWHGVIIDITDRKRIENALFESESRLTAAAKAANFGVYSYDFSGGQAYYSPEFLAMYASPPDTHLILDDDQVPTALHPDDKYGFLSRMRAANDPTGSGILEHTYRIIHPDGQVRWLRVTGQTIFSGNQPDDRPLHANGVIQDITQGKRLEEEQKKLEQQRQQLQKAESLKTMAGAIAHHFNNQLGVVIGNLEMAIEDLPPGSSTESLNEAMKASHRAVGVSSLMLTYLGQSVVKRTLLDLSETCRQSLPLLQAMVPKEMLFTTNVPIPGPIIIANENQILQVLTNLITNALEAEDKDQGAINLTVKMVSHSYIPAIHRFPVDWQSQDSTYVCIAVADTGFGIEEDDIAKIFDPFFSSKFPGRGLGLAVILGIVEAHDGVVTVESKKGRGSTFRVFLPMSGEQTLPQ